MEVLQVDVKLTTRRLSTDHSIRLLGLAAQKFVSDIASDAFAYARTRTASGPGRAPSAGNASLHSAPNRYKVRTSLLMRSHQARHTMLTTVYVRTGPDTHYSHSRRFDRRFERIRHRERPVSRTGDHCGITTDACLNLQLFYTVLHTIDSCLNTPFLLSKWVTMVARNLRAQVPWKQNRHLSC